jgi:hypothetical protein
MMVMGMTMVNEELIGFIDGWQETNEQNKKAFLFFKELLESMQTVALEFVPREGVTYSLRAQHENQTAKPLFVMVDVIEGDPRWLSICFYAEMITDPEEKGDFVPGGLLGEDACCFDMEEYNEIMLHYLEQRMYEAYKNAGIAA